MFCFSLMCKFTSVNMFYLKNRIGYIIKEIANILEVKNPPNYKKGVTPLHCAVTYGKFDICQFIVDNVQDKNPADEIGLTPLHLAAKKGHLSICQLILENVEKKDPRTKYNDGYGRTPYDFAKSNDHSEICQLIKNFKGNRRSKRRKLKKE